MKKEIAAALILILLFIGTLINIRVVDRLTGDILSLLDQAEQAAQAQNVETAIEKTQAAADLWHGADAYTHIFIRHSEIDSTTDAFYELLIQLDSGETDGAKGAFQSLRAHLTSISGMEQVTLGSVL